MTPPGLKTCASRPASLGFEAQDGRRITVLTVLQGDLLWIYGGDSGFLRDSHNFLCVDDV